MRKAISIVFLVCSFSLLGLHAHAQKLSRIDSLERVFDILTDHKSRVDVLNQLSWAVRPTSTERARSYAERGLTIAGNVGYQEGISKSLLTLGSIAMLENNDDDAIARYEEVKTIEEERNNWPVVALTQNYIGAVYLKKKQYAKALEYFTRAFEWGEAAGDEKSMIMAQGYIGTLHYEQGNINEAVQDYLQAFERLDDRAAFTELATPFYNLGMIYKSRDDLEKAKVQFNKALGIHNADVNLRGQALINLELGTIALEEQETTRALVYLVQALDQAQRAGAREYISRGYKKLSEAYYQANDFENAFKYERIHSAIRESLLSPKFEENLDTEIIKTKLLIAEKERELAQANASNYNLITIGLTSGFGLMIIFLFFMLRQYRAKTKALAAQQKAKERAERSDIEKEKFLAYTSHEIRTPLNAVVGMIQLLRKTELSVQQRKYIDTVKSSSDNILVIVNDILDLSRIDSGKIEFEVVDFMVTELIEEIVYMMRPKANSKGIELRAEIDKDIPAVIKGDPLRINQILLNLINNAVKFTEEGEVVLVAHLLSAKDGTAKIGFSVTDTGIGIKKEKLSSVFNRFEQEDTNTTRKYGGAGLGLSITKQLVELQGGNISVRSKYREGSTFSVRLEFPIGEVSADAVKSVSREVEVAPRRLNDIRVLLVDDNSLNIEILYDLLKSWNKTIVIDTAEDGKSAIQHLERYDYDVILMDIQMPRMNGYQACQHIRERMQIPKSQTPVIAMTAHALSRIEEEMREAGMNDYVSKPIDIGDLTMKISKLVKTKSAAAQPVSGNGYETIDLENLKALTRNDNGKIIKYIDIFLKNVTIDLENLKACVYDEDWDGLGKAAHKMKGNSAYMGIHELDELFTAAQDYDESEMEPEDVESMIRQIDEVCAKAVRELHMVKEELLATG